MTSSHPFPPSPPPPQTTHFLVPLRTNPVRYYILLSTLLSSLSPTSSASPPPSPLLLSSPSFSLLSPSPCPPNSQPASVQTLATCLCPIGHYFSNNLCTEYLIPNNITTSGISAGISAGIPAAISAAYTYEFSWEPFTFVQQNRQALFFLVSLILIIVWLVLSCAVRFIPLGDGNKPRGGWRFLLRYELSRLDRRYHRKHWLDEQKVLIKRRSELGGICSVSSYIFTVGSLAGLTYQQFAVKEPTTQSLVPNYGRDLSLFENDVSWHFDLISGMNCSQYNISSTTVDSALSMRTVNETKLGGLFYCNSTDRGLRMNFKCPKCQRSADNYNVTITFFDLPGQPAMATGLEFFLETKNGELRSSAGGSARPMGVLRGPGGNVLQWRLIPRILEDEDPSEIFQSTFHQYYPGTVLNNTESILASVNSSNVLKITVFIEVMSQYIVKSAKNSISLGDILTWLAELGGMYQLSITLFYLLQLQLEIRLRFLAYDESLLRMVHRVARRRALWKKVGFQLRATMRAYFLLIHWKEHKARWDEEQRLEAEKMKLEEEEKLLGKETKKSTRKEGFYSGFLKKRRGNRSPEFTEGLSRPADNSPKHDMMNNGKKSDIPSILEETEPFVEKDKNQTENDENETEKGGENRHHKASFSAVKSMGEVGKTVGAAVTSTSSAIGNTVIQGGKTVLHGAQTTGSLVLHLGTGIVQGAQSGATAVGRFLGPSEKEREGEDSEESPGRGERGRMQHCETMPDTRRQDKEDPGMDRRAKSLRDPQWEEKEGEGERRNEESKNRGFSGIFTQGQTFLHDAASSLHAAAHSMPRMPHVSFNSRRVPSFLKGPDELAGAPVDSDVAPEGQERKKSKSYLTYGSNSHHKGTIVREWRKPSWLLKEDNLPAAPCIEALIKDDDPLTWDDLYRHAYDVYHYNVRLRDDYLAFQTQMENTIQYFRPQSDL